MSVVAETATLAWDYTLADVERCTRKALALGRGRASLDFTERRESAWHAIVELLYDSKERPTERELVMAGGDAITYARNHQFHHHGLDINTAQPMPAFGKYWRSASEPHDFTDALIDRLALPQVLALLTPGQYEAVAALAAHGSYADAAEAIGANKGTFAAQIYQARKRFLAAWLEGDTPRPLREQIPSGGTCRRGHSREHTVTRYGKTYCTECQRRSQRDYRRRQRALEVAGGEYA